MYSIMNTITEMEAQFHFQASIHALIKDQLTWTKENADSYYEFLEQSESEVAQSCPTLCDPVDCNPPGSSVHGILQARILEWVAISFSKKAHGILQARTLEWVA